jgi:hypothetical protein
MAAKKLSSNAYTTFLSHLHDKWINKKKAVTMKYTISSREVIFAVLKPNFKGLEESLDNITEIEGVVTGQFKFSFKCYLDSNQDVTYKLFKMSRLIPKELIGDILHRILVEQNRRFSFPGGGMPKGIHIKALPQSTPFNNPKDSEGYVLALKSGLFHKDFVDFSKPINVACRIS